MKNLILAPHQDDEIIGLAATMCREIDKTDFHIVYTTNGAPLVADWYPNAGCNTPREYSMKRKTEAIKSANALGIPSSNLDFLVFSDLSLTDNLRLLSRTIQTIIEQNNPRCVYVPAFERGHPDHDATFLATYSALQKLQERGLNVSSFEYFLYSYYGGKETFNSPPDERQKQVIVLDSAERSHKNRLLQMHESQIGAQLNRYMPVQRQESTRGFSIRGDYPFEERMNLDHYFLHFGNFPVDFKEIELKQAEYVSVLQNETIKHT